MRVWDARHAACLDVVLDHGADVYGEDAFFTSAVYVYQTVIVPLCCGSSLYSLLYFCLKNALLEYRFYLIC